MAKFEIFSTTGDLVDEAVSFEGKRFKTVRSKSRTVPFSIVGKIQSIIVVLEQGRTVALDDVDRIEVNSKEIESYPARLILSSAKS